MDAEYQQLGHPGKMGCGASQGEWRWTTRAGFYAQNAPHCHGLTRARATHTPASSVLSRVPKREDSAEVCHHQREFWHPSLWSATVFRGCVRRSVCQEQGEGLSVEHGVRDHVDGGTGRVGWDTSLPLHTMFLIAELLRPLPGSHWVRRARKSQGMGALLHQTAQNDFPGGVTGLTSPTIPGPPSWGCLCPSKRSSGIWSSA